MKFNETQFFDTLDDLDFETTEDLLSMFKEDFARYNSDIYGYICNLETKDVVLLFTIVSRFVSEV